MRDAWLDLVLGSACTVCALPGRTLCAPCEAALPTQARAAWPTPTPAGLVRPSSTGEYADALRVLVNEHKERTRLELAAPLGRLLAAAVLETVRAATAADGVPARLALVPVPSHPAVVRRRGHDPVRRMSRVAASRLRALGLRVRVLPLLATVTRPEDQAGLGAEARAANLSGRFVARGRRPSVPVVLVDDVITTGTTLREAQRALEAAGIHPIGAATVAATRRRTPVRWDSLAAPGCRD